MVPSRSFHPSGLGMTFLLGGLILVFVFMLLISFVPVAECPLCSGNGIVVDTINTPRPRVSVMPCPEAHRKGKVTFLRRWFMCKNAPAP